MENKSKLKPVVAVVSTKGGVGKSMITTNLAVAATLDGFKTIIINADFQQSAIYWNKHRKANAGLNAIDVYQWDPHKGQLSAALTGIPSWEVAVIDAPGTDDDKLRSALLAANTVIVPTTPSLEDFEVLRYETIPLLQKFAKQFPNRQWNARIVVNSWSIMMGLHRDTLKALSALQSDFEFCTTKLRRLADYQNARAVGMGVQEYDPKSNAAKDFANFYTELKPLL
ncbi:MAG TPA: ParA family protein [Stenomitos sp.]